LAKKYLDAVEQAKLHEEDMELMTNGLPEELAHSWEAVVTTWENDRSSPNPYYAPTMSMHPAFQVGFL
jgi:hypothetical protein